MMDTSQSFDFIPLRPIYPEHVEEQIYLKHWQQLMHDQPELFDTMLAASNAKPNQRAAQLATSFICWLATPRGTALRKVSGKISPDNGAYAAAWAQESKSTYLMDSTADTIASAGPRNILTPQASANDHLILNTTAAFLDTKAGQNLLAAIDDNITSLPTALEQPVQTATAVVQPLSPQ